MSKEKELFDLLEEIGDGDYDGVHLILSDEYYGKKYRVYSSKGYCFDVKQEPVCEPEEIGEYSKDYDGIESDGNTYSFYNEWDGFDYIEIEKAIELLKSIQWRKAWSEN